MDKRARGEIDALMKYKVMQVVEIADDKWEQGRIPRPKTKADSDRFFDTVRQLESKNWILFDLRGSWAYFERRK